MYYSPNYYPIWCQKSTAGNDQVTPMVSDRRPAGTVDDTNHLVRVISQMDDAQKLLFGMRLCTKIFKWAHAGLVSDQIFSSRPGDTK